MGRQLYEAIVSGILGGGVYALMAVGLTLIFGVLDIINIAQGIMVILGAYLSYVLSVHLHIDLFVGLLVTVPAMFVLGVVIQLAFMRPLRGSERTSMSLLASYAVAIIIEGVLYSVFGATGGGFNPNTGYDLISRLLAIIILGGLGSIGGAMVAAIFMITLEAVVDVVWSPSWAIVVFYGALVLVLSVRPAGIFGKKEARAQ